MSTIDPEAISTAHERTREYLRRTPVLTLARGDLHADVPVVLKLELLQHTGSFKPRGAFNALLGGPLPAAGVIAASGGNHGAAVAYAAKALGVRAEVFVPETIPGAKLRKLEKYAATVTVVGRHFAEALEACRRRQSETGAKLVHAYDDAVVVAGQGTVALELQAQAPELDSLLVAVGGGGLIGGVASWYRGAVKVVAVESEGTATLHAARRAGEPVDIEVSGLAVDSLGARRIGDIGFDAAARYVSGAVLVSDDAIRAAQALLWDELRVAAEPGGATALAALLTGAYRPAEGERVGVLVCGGNADVRERVV